MMNLEKSTFSQMGLRFVCECHPYVESSERRRKMGIQLSKQRRVAMMMTLAGKWKEERFHFLLPAQMFA